MVLFPNSIAGAADLWRQMVLGGIHLHILTPVKLFEILAIFAGTALTQAALRRWPPRELVKNLDIAAVLRPAYAFAVAGLALYFAVSDASIALTPNKFIYFQF
jgi:hypothetical protein